MLVHENILSAVNLRIQNPCIESSTFSFLQDDILWTCLAGLAIYGRDLDTAEEAYAAVDLLDKVSFVQYIKVLFAEMNDRS